jgi:hypothetical protein
LRSLRERQTEFERQQYRLSLPQLIHRSGLDNELLRTSKDLTTCHLTNHRAPPLHGRCAYYYTIELEMELDIAIQPAQTISTGSVTAASPT